MVTGAAVAVHDLDWLKRNLPEDARVTITDVTSGLAVIGIRGPNSRALLNRLTPADLSNAAFPFGTSQELEIGFATLRALRITYVGALGWELTTMITVGYEGSSSRVVATFKRLIGEG